jgi:hypothetical protein
LLTAVTLSEDFHFAAGFPGALDFLGAFRNFLGALSQPGERAIDSGN